MHTDVIAGEIAARQLGLITIGSGASRPVSPTTRSRSGVAIGQVASGTAAACSRSLARRRPGSSACSPSCCGRDRGPSRRTSARPGSMTSRTRCANASRSRRRPGRSRGSAASGCTGPRCLPDHDVRVVDGIPVTSYARTLVDCTGRMSLGQIARALDAGLVRHDVTLWSVERSLAPLGQAPGRHPSKLWTLLAERGTETELGESRPEMRMFRVLDASGLPRRRSSTGSGSEATSSDSTSRTRRRSSRSSTTVGTRTRPGARSTPTAAGTGSFRSTDGSSSASRPRPPTPRSSKPSVRLCR